MRQSAATDPPANVQTVRLSRGRHSSPEQGVCVMELASMLAGEPFSDHPRSVCPVIGSFLRAYNDRLEDRWRQDLYAYAAKVVGTRSTIAVERRRAQLCREWPRPASAPGICAEELPGSRSRAGRLRGWGQGIGRKRAARRAAIRFGCRDLDQGKETFDSDLHQAALRFVDVLIAVGARGEQPLINSQAMCGHSERALNVRNT